MSTLKQQLATVNRWRSQFNPLRGLTIQRAASLLEEGERGAYADLQWTYRMIEKRHPTLRALKLRRLAAIARLDWNIKTVDDSDAAKRQAEFLRACYDRLDNLREAVRFLALAEFRGYAHLERQRIDPESGPVAPRSVSETNHLEPVEQWFWCRDGLYGAWEYNAEAASGRVHGASVDMSALLVREVDAPLNEIALIQFVRSGLCNKDWDAFIECYGIPRPVVVMPPNVPPEKESEYRSAAESIADGQSGAVPSGTEISWPPAGSARQHPFLERLQRVDEELVLAGTGGKLTMLSSPTGIGQGAAAQHEEVFLEIAAAEALEISEVFQKQFDALLLAERFPGQPALAYFELALPNKDDIGATIEHAVKLAQAGYAMDAAELSERTGYRLTPIARSAEAEPTGQRGLLNRLRRFCGALMNGDIPGHPFRGNQHTGGLEGEESADPRSVVGKTGDWRSLRLPSVEMMTPDVAAPMMSPNEARARLKSGFVVRTVLGDDAVFSARVLEHWREKAKSDKDVEMRLRSLKRAEAALKSPHEVWEDAQTGTRTFIHLVRDENKARVVDVFELRGGEVESFLSTSEVRRRGNYFRKGRLLYAR